MNTHVHWRTALAAMGVCAATAVGAAGLRLAIGPIELGAAKPLAEAVLAGQVDGGKARVGRAQLAWSAASNSLALRFNNVALDDRRGRPVIRARNLEAGLSAGSVLKLTPALGEAVARDFFVAVAVSPQGRYRLGYEAEGAPKRGGGLERLLTDLTGEGRVGRPVSFLRRLELNNGWVAFRHLGGAAAWRGRVTRVDFRKDGEVFAADLDADLRGRHGLTALKGMARGSVGLDRSVVRLDARNLVPWRVLPSAGATAMASRLDAPVNGVLSLDYGVKSGVRAAEARIAAGAGRILLARAFEPVNRARVIADFDPAAQRVRLRSFRLEAQRADFEVSGWARLLAETRDQPARVVWAAAAPEARLALASDRAPETITDLRAAGSWRPSAHEVEFGHVSGRLGGAAVSGRGRIAKSRPGRSWAVDFDAVSNGPVALRQVLAFWPQRLANKARTWLVNRGARGEVNRVEAAIHLPEGAVRRGRPLQNRFIRLSFAFDDGALSLRNDLPAIVGGVGAGVLQGDRLDLAVARASMGGVRLIKGSVVLPKLKGDGKSVKIDFRAQGAAPAMLRLVDGPSPHVLTRHGLGAERFGGDGDLTVSIVRPLGLNRPATLEDYDVEYEGSVSRAVVQRAALGMRLEAPALRVSGSTDRVSVTGPSRVGPYRGALDFDASFAKNRPKTTRAVLNGVLDGSPYGLGGPSGRSTLAFAGRFETRSGVGSGVIRGEAFSGQTNWRSGQGGSALLQGRLNTAALRRVGVPLTQSMPATAPVRLALNRSATGWSGTLVADPYSGGVALITGAAPRLRYVAELTPAESDRLGLGNDPAFHRVQRASIDLSARAGQGRAVYAVGPYEGALDWSKDSGGRSAYHWRAVLSEAALRALGLPAALKPKGPVPVDVNVRGARGAWAGTATLAGSPLTVASQAGAGGRRRLTVSGPVTADLLARLGAPIAGLSGTGDLAASFELAGKSLQSGRIAMDLTRAAVAAPAGAWTKAPGRALRLNADIVRKPGGGYELGRITGAGAGVDVDARAVWRPDGGVTFDARRLKLDTTFDGALTYVRDPAGRRLTVRALSFDARPMIRRLTSHTGSGGTDGAGGPIRLDLEVGELRATDAVTLRRARMSGLWGEPAQRRLEVSALAQGGGQMSLSLYPDGGATAVSGRIDNVSDTAATFFDIASFRGGQATVKGRLVPGGADLDVEMKNVRLIRAPLLAQILTLGSLKGMADTLNGGGIAFDHVVAPIKVRGSRVVLGHSRATGSAIGLTTQGVIDLDDRTVDLSGAVAPAYTLNGLMGNVPILGDLLVSRKGEGVFGMTYTAKGPTTQPRIMVNPLSLATPGILRRIFEGRSAVDAKPEPAG